MKSCCFTGHRQLNEAQVAPLLPPLMAWLYEQGVRDFMAGGAIGFDMLCAEAVLSFRETHKDIRLLLALPCPAQQLYYSPFQKKRYEVIVEKADDKVTLSPVYNKGCMPQRNRYMVEHSDMVVCYLTRKIGGTAYTVSYAKKLGKSVYNLVQTGDMTDSFLNRFS